MRFDLFVVRCVLYSKTLVRVARARLDNESACLRQVSMASIKELREKTGTGIADCKVSAACSLALESPRHSLTQLFLQAALVEAQGDMEAAYEACSHPQILRGGSCLACDHTMATGTQKEGPCYSHQEGWPCGSGGPGANEGMGVDRG